LLLLLCQCTDVKSDSSEKQKKKSNYIIIQLYCGNILSESRVNCESFREQFSHFARFKEIKVHENDSEYKMINKLYAYSKDYPSKGLQIDTRMRIESYINDTLANTMCFNQFAMASLSNKESLQINDSLFNYILKTFCNK